MDRLQSDILKTITWFDVIGYPVTGWEIYKFLYTGQGDACAYDEIISALDELTGSDKIANHEGFYFLPGRQQLVSDRKHRYLLAERKYRKARRVIRILSHIPWIRMISVCNTLGYSNAPEDSDIDLFIIVRPGRLWTARFLVISFLKFFGLRPLLARFGNYPEIRKDKLDANFFLSESHLSLESLAIKNDVYLAYWLLLQTPMYDPYGTYAKLIEANRWIKKKLPNAIINMPSYRRQFSRQSSIFRVILAVLNPGEFLCQKLQMKIMPQHLKALANQDTGVVINEHMLKFHDQDKRQYFRDLWLKKSPT